MIGSVATTRDYEEWLTSYDDEGSPLSWRLRRVQSWLGQTLDARSGPLTVLSLCAGDGRDVLDTLAGRDDADRVSVVLVELHPGVARRARDRATAAGLTDVDVRVADAAETDAYLGVVPADVVLLGNISAEDLERTLASTPQLCRPGATLIWSRGRDQDDLNARVRAQLLTVGFSELDYVELDCASRPALGLMRYDGPPTALVPGQHLFTFWR